jgi:hypothetical protein
VLEGVWQSATCRRENATQVCIIIPVSAVALGMPEPAAQPAPHDCPCLSLSLACAMPPVAGSRLSLAVLATWTKKVSKNETGRAAIGGYNLQPLANRHHELPSETQC